MGSGPGVAVGRGGTVGGGVGASTAAAVGGGVSATAVGVRVGVANAATRSSTALSFEVQLVSAVNEPNPKSRYAIR